MDHHYYLSQIIFCHFFLGISNISNHFSCEHVRLILHVKVVKVVFTSNVFLFAFHFY